MHDVLSNIMVLGAFGLFEIFVGAWRLYLCNEQRKAARWEFEYIAWRLYVFARTPTNSRGGTDPVSLLNFPSSRRLS